MENQKEDEMSNGNANEKNTALSAEGTRLPMAERLTRQSQAVQQLLGTVLTKGRHYGVVNAGDKSTLLKAGAEKLALGFGLAPEFEGERLPVDLGEGHREYVIVCRLRSLSSSQVVCSGLGSCSTRESRLRARFVTEGNNQEACLADVYNMVLKQAKKRALVDAVLTATAASDLFTQDMEDLSSVAAVAKPIGTTKPAVPLKASPGSPLPSPAPSTRK